MREIEFQGIDEASKIYDLLAINYKNMTGLCEVEGVSGFTWCRFQSFRQYTGLKDKNGKKIFEGDYLEDHRGFKYEVKRVQGGFGINTFANEFGKKWTFWTATSDMQTSGYIKESCEVVGNIFENTIEE